MSRARYSSDLFLIVSNIILEQTLNAYAHLWIATSIVCNRFAAFFWLLVQGQWLQLLYAQLFALWTATSRIVFALMLAYVRKMGSNRVFSMHFVYFSAILTIAGGDYPWWFALGPAIILVITDASKNLALLQMFSHTLRAAYATQTALIGAVYDKVS